MKTRLVDRLNLKERAPRVIRQLDLLIMVDAAVAHLAGAMGIPVCILLQFAPDWRWMLDRTDTPWYGSTVTPANVRAPDVSSR